jgi:hydroxymethylpyrimidine pyrophosphatase-like HAD family hydrolase
MENANKDIKEMADEIVTDNDHNGTGEAIKKFLLQLQ